MERRLIGLPAGFRDVLFEEARAKRAIEEKLARIFEAEGYGEVIPSGVEFLDVYTRGNQGIRDRTFKFLDKEDNLLALRADFTPAIARIVAGRLSGAPLPLKIWYSGTVFRKADMHRGAYHELGQIGAELIGLNSVERDAEILTVALRCLESLALTDIKVHVNHAGIFGGIVDSMGLNARGLGQVKAEIDRKDARGLAARLRDLGVPRDLSDQVRVLAQCVGGPEVLEKAEASIGNERSMSAIAVLRDLSKRLAGWNDAVVFDLAEIDELEYYTGAIFTFFSPKLRGELGKGGRYDSLLAEFGAAMPAVGFSFSVERLTELV